MLQNRKYSYFPSVNSVSLWFNCGFKINPLHKPLHGKVGRLMFKHYANKVVVTRAPTFSGQWSTAQQDGRKRFALASAYARTVCADSVLRA